MRHIAWIITLLTAAANLAQADHRVQMRWEGDVNRLTRLYIRGDRVDVDNRVDYQSPRVTLNSPLPSEPVRVDLNVIEGRGRVRVIEQPSDRNNYTAVVEIDPRRNASDHYIVELSWDDRGAFSNSPFDPVGQRNRTGDGYYGRGGSMNWSGTVDDEAIIEVSGRNVYERSVRGQRPYTRRADFSSDLPRTGVSVQLVDEQGRGRVELIEQPTRSNGYRARVRITDHDSGAGEYAFALRWDDAGGRYGDPPNVDDRRDRDPFSGTQRDRSFGNNPDVSYGERVMRWYGRVDNKVSVAIMGNRASYQVVQGAPPSNVRVDFGSPLPRGQVNASIDKKSGRGDVRLIEQPSAANGYRLLFQIEDDSGGSDDYEVEVRW